MWYKKWCLPRIQVHVTQAGVPLNFASGSGVQLSAVCSAGTFRDGQPGLHDTGLTGECQVRLDSSGVATFSSLRFQHTSFSCGNRPFHLVITLLASLATDLASPQRKAVVLASVCSSPIHVYSRKR